MLSCAGDSACRASFGREWIRVHGCRWLQQKTQCGQCRAHSSETGLDSDSCSATCQLKSLNCSVPSVLIHKMRMLIVLFHGMAVRSKELLHTQCLKSCLVCSATLQTDVNHCCPRRHHHHQAISTMFPCSKTVDRGAHAGLNGGTFGPQFLS